MEDNIQAQWIRILRNDKYGINRKAWAPGEIYGTLQTIMGIRQGQPAKGSEDVVRQLEQKNFQIFFFQKRLLSDKGGI